MEAIPQSAARGTERAFARRSYRHSICTLAYVRIDHSNGGIIRNLSDGGMGIQAVGRLHPDQVVHLRFEFIRPRAKFELVGQVTWANAQGQAGLRFTDIPLRCHRLLMDWILTDLLTAATELQGARGSEDVEDGLLVSKACLRPIRLTAEETEVASELTRELLEDSAGVCVSWWPVPIGQRSFARFVDGMTVISAVLLFSVIVAQITGMFPSWRMLLASEACLAVFVGLMYCVFCNLTIGSSLGSHLAKLAAAEADDAIIESRSDAQ